MIRRICIHCGSGNGKSTLAADIFQQLKKEHYNAELVQEFFKKWAVQKYKVNDFDQYWAFSNHLRDESFWLENGVDLIVTCCPLFLNCCYAERAKALFSEEEWKIAEKFENQFPAYNIFLKRDTIPYSEIGRYQTYEQAIALDDEFMKILDNRGIWLRHNFKLMKRDEVMEEIKRKL